MGLDMYLYKTKMSEEEYNELKRKFHNKEIDYDDLYEIEYERFYEIGYWRKHPNLHGYIEMLWREREGINGDFCELFLLTKEDIQAIIEGSKKQDLPHTEGFFFGKSYPEDHVRTIKIMEQALEFIEAGYTIIYNSSW